MQIQVRKLRETLALLAPVIPRKTALPITYNSYFGHGVAVATNLEVLVRIDLPEAEEPVLLHNKAVLDLLKNVPGDMVADIFSAKGQPVTIVCGTVKATYKREDPEDFPSVGDAEDPKVQFQIDGDKLVDGLSMAVQYVATETTRPVLNAVCFSIAEDKSEVIGADGFRLLVKELPIKLPPATIIIPSDTVHILEDLWRKAPKDIQPDLFSGVVAVALSKHMMGFGFNSGQMRLTWGGITILSQLVQGTFPNYKQLIPDPPNRIKLFGPDLYQALRQVSKVATEGSGIVRLVWAEKQMQVSSKGENTSASTSFPILEGAEGRIAINLGYLLQYLKDKGGIVEMAISTPSAPVLLLDGRSTVVIMPMYVQWEGDPPKSEAVTQAESIVAEVEDKTEPEQVPGVGQVEAGIADAELCRSPKSSCDWGDCVVAEAKQAEAKTIAECEQPKPKRKRKVKAKA